MIIVPRNRLQIDSRTGFSLSGFDRLKFKPDRLKPILQKCELELFLFF